ncbi:MAG: DHA2 family efflux MFS transporter permease subunit [Candidatus Dormibacteraeota bacterium]|nr:DHA2 family efflux MFS transporter permease subunit [Candidatus Dormibacteraeota bacterium]
MTESPTETGPRGGLAPQRLSKVARRWILAAAILGSGVVFLDGTVVTVAMARIGRELSAGPLNTLEAQTFVYSGYLLALSAVLVPAGAAGDRWGRRRVFMAGLAGFGAASLLCGLAPNMVALILFRIVQGMAGAFLIPGSLALLRVNLSGPEQGRAYGVWTAGTALTGLAGPFLGGVLVDAVSWRAVFLINVPIILVALYAAWGHVPESHVAEPGHLDWLGAGLFALAAGGLSFGVIYGQAREWRSALAWAALAVGAVATVALPLWLRRAAHPLVPPSLFRSRAFTVINVATLVIYGGLYVVFYYQPLFLQGVAGWSATLAGLAGIPGSLILIVLSPRAGRLAGRVGPRPFLVIGPLLMAFACLWLARIPSHVTYVIDVLPASILSGLGLGLMVTPLTTALMTSVPSDHAGVASAFNNAISRVGPQLAGAAVFVAVSAAFFAKLGAHPPGVAPLNAPLDPVWKEAATAASTDAFHLAMLFCAGLLVAAALISLAGLRRPAAVGSGAPEVAAAPD